MKQRSLSWQAGWMLSLALVLSACATVNHGDVNLPPSKNLSPRSQIPPEALQEMLSTLTSGESMTWSNDMTNAVASIRLIGTFRVETGQYCRDYEVSTVDQDNLFFYWIETACLFENKNWRILSSSRADDELI